MNKLALLFPGQGAQEVGMGRELYEAYAPVRELYDTAQSLVDFDLKAISFEGPEDQLRRTDVSQPAIVIASLAALKALEHELGGAIPGVAAACGLSLGEYTALCYAGVLSLGDTLELVILRGRAMQTCCDQTEGAMTSVMGVSLDALQSIVSEIPGVGVANDNSPRQIVLSGTRAALEAASEKAREAGARRLFPLSVAGAYHSALMAPAGERLAEALASRSFGAPTVTVLANIDAAPYEQADGVTERLVRQVSGTVRWRQSMSQLAALGVTRALELGPGGVLKGLMKQNQRGLTVDTITTPTEVRAAAEALKEHA